MYRFLIIDIEINGNKLSSLQKSFEKEFVILQTPCCLVQDMGFLCFETVHTVQHTGQVTNSYRDYITTTVQVHISITFPLLFPHIMTKE